MQSVIFILLQGYFKKDDIQFKHINVLRNEGKKYSKVFLQKYSTLLFKWMTSQAYNNNDILFPPQIWKQPH